jgi:tetratricopeptide (TPR) repeat protein
MDAAPSECPQDRIDAVVAMLREDDTVGLAALERLITEYPNDARLHFLKGSILAGLQRYDEGGAAMAHALECAPDFALARFQYGFLELTCGRADKAAELWAPMDALPESDPFRIFATALRMLARDQLADAAALLERGIANNQIHPLINADMQLIIDETRRTLAANTVADPADEATTQNQMLFQRYGVRDTSAYRTS